MSSIRYSTRSSTTPSTSRGAGRGRSRPALVAGIAAAIALGGFLLATAGPRLALLFAIAIGCGVTLHHAAFGFASAYRRLLLSRDAAGAKAQLLMLAVATMLFAPVLASGAAFGMPMTGAAAPFAWQVAIGAFMFGIGMQLGDGCGSGTLYKVGGGSARSLATLVAFCAGGFWASLDMGSWQRLPDLGAIVLGEKMGWRAAVALQLGFLAVLYLLLRIFERGRSDAEPPVFRGWRRVLSGPWSLAAGAMLLAALNFSTLVTAGHPWSITWGFTLWAAKAATFAGWSPMSADFWAGGFQREALDAPLLRDVTSVMDIGLLVGALGAAGLAGRFEWRSRIPLRSFVGAVAGGLMMGYGARIAYGCNIGAFFSGVASTSLHGWLWILAALPGSWIGARMRPRFGLPP